MEKVYNDIKNCCGCGACAYVCPKQAIAMVEGESGFMYPSIDQSKCVNCGLCAKSCIYQKKDKGQGKIVGCFAAVNTDNDLLQKSTSGGLFSAIAKEFIVQGGVVCGAAMEFVDGVASVKHILINEVEELSKLQGSKYVHSNMWLCLPTIKEKLAAGKKVLFSGTPCQVSAVKNIFKRYSGTQLFTIDIICHGVPGQKFFNDYLKEKQKGKSSRLVNFEFRNKKWGWGLDGCATYNDGSTERITVEESSYYQFFLNGEIYRENCYLCPYACLNRPGDITIGDYWGVETYDPQIMKENGGAFSKEAGVSCLLVNHETGWRLLENYGKDIYKEEVDLEHILIINKQLREPAIHTQVRDNILSLWKSNGYSAVEGNYQKRLRKIKLKRRIKAIIPTPVKSFIKRLLGK